MKFEDHCKESIELFGEAFEEVHQWLDEFAGQEPYGMRHRKVRHHLAGIREAEKLFGKKGAQVAKQHILSDLEEVGWKRTKNHFPINEVDYVKMGLY